jgi:CDP-glycerol glycerophosphotransferase
VASARAAIALPTRGALVGWLMRALLTIVPPRRQVLVYGWPDWEGNAVCLLRYLSISTAEKDIVWLANGNPQDNPQYAPWLNHVIVKRKSSIAGLWAYLRSDVVCFTHGLYSSPRPSRGRVFINLWHGDGPKRTENAAFQVRPGASAVVAGTRLWGEMKAADFDMSPQQVLVVGNPRIDDFDEPLTSRQQTALDDLLGPRFIVWMPTYRDSNGAGFREWSDGPRLTDAGHVASLGDSARQARREHGVQVVVKAHPMDRDNYAGAPGLLTLDDDWLNQQRLSLYQLLGASSGLVTDYSSVWTDYLVVNRPILLFCPDYVEYGHQRGFNVPDLHAVAPGPLVTSLEAFQDFVAAVASGVDTDAARRREVAERIGCVTTAGASGRLWDAISHMRAPSK